MKKLVLLFLLVFIVSSVSAIVNSGAGPLAAAHIANDLNDKVPGSCKFRGCPKYSDKWFEPLLWKKGDTMGEVMKGCYKHLGVPKDADVKGELNK